MQQPGRQKTERAAATDLHRREHDHCFGKRFGRAVQNRGHGIPAGPEQLLVKLQLLRWAPWLLQALERRQRDVPLHRCRTLHHLTSRPRTPTPRRHLAGRSTRSSPSPHPLSPLAMYLLRRHYIARERFNVERVPHAVCFISRISSPENVENKDPKISRCHNYYTRGRNAQRGCSSATWPAGCRSVRQPVPTPVPAQPALARLR